MRCFRYIFNTEFFTLRRFILSKTIINHLGPLIQKKTFPFFFVGGQQVRDPTLSLIRPRKTRLTAMTTSDRADRTPTESHPRTTAQWTDTSRSQVGGGGVVCVMLTWSRSILRNKENISLKISNLKYQVISLSVLQ